MTVEEAIKEIETNVRVREPIHTASACVLLQAYKELALVHATVAPKLLDEMQQAADWQAVSSRLMYLLRNRDKPGMAEVITETLKQLDADQAKPKP